MSVQLPTMQTLSEACSHVSSLRPKPLREYDQIYMHDYALANQCKYVMPYLNGTRILYLGDGDGASSVIALASSSSQVRIKEQVVIDFDERVLHGLKRCGSNTGLIQTEYYLHNVIDPSPEDLLDRFDFFYINPPYGSLNCGKSITAWIHRCMDMCTSSSMGCIIMPDDDSQQWTKPIVGNVLSFLYHNGYSVVSKNPSPQTYDLIDNPTLESKAYIVERTSKVNSSYYGTELPTDILQTLYGRPRAIPHFILEDKETGEPAFNFDWRYGVWPF